MESYNYKWSMSYNAVIKNNVISGSLERIGFFEIAFSPGDVYSFCLNIRTHAGRKGFADGGFWAYTGNAVFGAGTEHLFEKYDNCAALPAVLDDETCSALFQITL
jgi:hypothetical protein